MRYLSAEQVAELLCYKNGRQVVERLSRIPGFPVPVRFPTLNGGVGHPRWIREEIIAWADSQRAAA